MSLDPPSYLFSLQNNIRQRPIPWDGAVRANHISDADLKKIKAVDKVRRNERKEKVEADVDGYRALFLGNGSTKGVFESAAKRPDVVQYTLVLAADLIDDVPALSTSLLAHPTPYKPFLPLLSQSSTPEDPIPLLASTIISSLVARAFAKSSRPSPQSEKALPDLFKYLSMLANSQDSGLQDIAVQEYSAILRSEKSRKAFWLHKEETITPLVAILRTAAGVQSNGDSTVWSGAASVRSLDSGLGGGVGLQLLYHILLVFWQLSFESGLVGDGLEEDHEIIPLFTQLLRLSPKEKTTRLLLSILLNLLSANKSSLLPAATLARLPVLLQNLKGRHLTDADLLEDLSALTELLDEYTRTQTTFDEYAAEVRSGHLHWSPPHRNGTFWAENARKIISELQGELPKKLAEIMAKPWDNDKQVLAIACNDVACLVKEVPEQRAKLEKLGLKARCLELMGSADEQVRWESLRATGEWLRYSFDR
ncbi:MAG: H(+)-transporting V1 sector ATPase subunit H [Vezdaea aestivalis]|nr:MAG: H(+)-transporting V1 sector ATPase subunit H [Vezdaea aestivalis]